MYKKDDSQFVNNIDLLIVQNGEKICIGPGILYYYERMLACLLKNLNAQNAQLGIVNGAQTLVYEVIFDL